MLSIEDNEYLTKIGPGTPMGTLFRRYWMPFLMSIELPGPDCDPLRVRLLGEDLVAVRDTNGNVGLLDNYCPHRRASLFFGRNEECGLRCVYHGWKFDVDGNCVDMPSEPAESNFKDKVHITSYPTQDWGGVLWAYLGPQDQTPELPELEWARVPEDHRFVTKRLQESNWAQGVEGGVDSSHVSFLHRVFADVQEMKAGKDGFLVQRPIYMIQDKSPKFFVRDTPYGFAIGARRNAEEGHYYWRLSQVLMPAYTIIPSAAGRYLTGHAWVPIDDENCWAFTFSWHPDRPLTEEELEIFRAGDQNHAVVDPITFRNVANADNDYLIDREMQRNYNYTGVRGVGTQDTAIQESMSPITGRSKEHLGTSDTAMIYWRRLMIDSARAVLDGAEARGAKHGDAYRIRGGAMVLPQDADPFETSRTEFLATS